jgi:predicted phosphodiesterase
MKMRNYEKSLFVGDIHAPYQDPFCMKVIEDFSRWFKPQWVFILGDLVDFYQLSKFDKDPVRMDCLQDDLDSAKSELERLRTANPKAKIVLFEGNHESRLRKWLWNNPEVSSLRALTIHELLSLSKYNIQWVGALETYTYHDFALEHGDIVRKHSGYTARGMMEKRGVSGISGHTHRMGTHYLTNMGGDFVWVENGCLCDRHPSYVRDPNWQNGFSVGFFKKSDPRFTINQVCIPDGLCVYSGREFGTVKS